MQKETTSSFLFASFSLIVFQSICFSCGLWRLHNEWAKKAILLILLTDACLLKLVDIQKQASLLRDFSHWCLFPKTCWHWSVKKFKWQHLKIFVYFHAYLQLGIHCVQSCFTLLFSFFLLWGSKFWCHKNVKYMNLCRLDISRKDWIFCL